MKKMVEAEAAVGDEFTAYYNYNKKADLTSSSTLSSSSSSSSTVSDTSNNTSSSSTSASTNNARYSNVGNGSGDQGGNGSSGGDGVNGKGIIKMELHPILPPSIRLLLQQQSSLQDVNDDGDYDDDDEEEEEEEEHELHQHHRQLHQQLLEEAIASLRGVGAAYTSLMEFTPTTTFASTTRHNSTLQDSYHGHLMNHNHERDTTIRRRRGRRNLQQLEQLNNEHNEAIREYNTHYRRYSRYQWAIIRNEEAEMVEGNSGGRGRGLNHQSHQQQQQRRRHHYDDYHQHQHRRGYHNNTFINNALARKLKNDNNSNNNRRPPKEQNLSSQPPPPPSRGRGGGEGGTNKNNNNNVGMTKKKGGIFNSYQTSPLHQGYGTHYATIWVGTPPQRQSVIIDTGSHFTAFPCKGCVNCGEEHHTDKYFDPDVSSTFRALTCNECLSGRCSSEHQQHNHDGVSNDEKCVFSQAYTEGSSWSAYESMDKVFMGGAQLDNTSNNGALTNPTINEHFRGDFMFGCQTQESGLFVTQLADGIMGVSNHPMTYPNVMYDQGKLEHNMFSLCFRRELHVSKRGIVAGMITLGGIDTRADHAPMVYAKNVATSGWFTVFVKRIYIRHNGDRYAETDGLDQKMQKLDVDVVEMNSGKGVIIDSGTTDTYLHASIAEQFKLAWDTATEGRWKFSNDRSIELDGEQLLRLPTILIQMAAYGEFALPNEKTSGLAGEEFDPNSPQDIILAIPASNYMEYAATQAGVVQGKGTYTPRIYFTEKQGSVIGANAMQGHNVLFDRENGRVGFAESSCEYQEDSKAMSGEGGVMSVDCRLGAPSLSVSCSESADLSRCRRIGSNSDTTLDGLEIWSRIVQSPGMPQGLTCEEVALQQNELNGGEEMEVSCDGKGICREVRKCIISCANAIAHGAAAVNAALTPIGSCGAAAWSACDYSCTQTKLNSILMSDGKCHEDKALQATRPCHVQSCGRSDPCRVPFVVHAIIKIRGAVVSHWTKHAEEIFVEAFATAINGRKGKDLVFGPGDVVVLSATPWRANDDTFVDSSLVEGEDEELGMQLVVEVSIFNYNAEIPPTTGGKGAPLAICHERDLQPLANVALNMHKKLAQSDFVKLVVEEMKNDESIGEIRMSPFYRTFEQMQLAQESQVVTSWTIKTDVGTEYPSNGFDAFGDLLSVGYFLMIAMLCSITAYTICHRLYLNKKFRSNKSNRVHWANDDDTVRAIADDNYNYDERTVMTDDISAYTTTTNESISESYRSIGSLSTYLEKSSRRANPLIQK